MTLQQVLEAIEELNDDEREIIAEVIMKKRQKHRSILTLSGIGATGKTAEEIDADIEKMKDEWDERERQWR